MGNIIILWNIINQIVNEEISTVPLFNNIGILNLLEYARGNKKRAIDCVTFALPSTIPSHILFFFFRENFIGYG